MNMVKPEANFAGAYLRSLEPSIYADAREEGENLGEANRSIFRATKSLTPSCKFYAIITSEQMVAALP